MLHNVPQKWKIAKSEQNLRKRRTKSKTEHPKTLKGSHLMCHVIRHVSSLKGHVTARDWQEKDASAARSTLGQRGATRVRSGLLAGQRQIGLWARLWTVDLDLDQMATVQSGFVNEDDERSTF
ncbi:hypothetical protein PIB30_056280 [Stylosanthes scabra]|uniref:Uncharacterized protein n=1 Tax=Stylosanthes scabra TaxID=79078 RepID=A0ABU6VJJ0_9FABA|nr:hypothetical protein [Stylosanthes scabra]